ncbi:glycosyl transferase family 1 [Thermosipho melanesiensis]|uniref:Uncharacterized protein n=2 Tax=Thermosipho melanesiensis TaxID=46541 RepID=A6LJY0_THEM4|nr:glycosyltransferase [Thermosipho melanesiensis]ABR30231.1 hypothetical protein Tmel_0362 [Thermosipho melanesiensis BI429]APT73421.1 glycosyl transferase family 1 [Thermosipho melanesiensis]OOC37364.1 glycosyl transferase family 1 [Thermosipho melanesiensis]OOC39726.1 glycosyl transferase family 1 [Thermosipho melanesiensis]OOC39831.1 glycosyl transferase family 1 [Thermosipho melanesiensis]
MKIFIVGYTHSKYDKRVFKTVKLLSKSNQVIYQYLTFDDEKVHKNGNIIFVPVTYKAKTKKYFGKTSTLINNFSSIKKFDRKIFDMIKTFDYDIIYFHYFLVSMPVKAFKVAKNKGKKVVYDLHEYHPENHFKNLKGLAKKVKEKLMWKVIKNQFFFSDKLIFVSEEARNDMLNILKTHKDSIVIPNYANIKLKSPEKIKEIVIVGKTPRNIQNEREILKNLNKEGFSIKIVGIKTNILNDIPCKYTDVLPYDKMMVEVSKSAFSLISYKSFGQEYKNYIYSFPHKFFDSIAAGTPVIVNRSFVSMKNEVEKYGIGIVIEPQNVKESVRKILEAYKNYEKFLENIETYKDRYVWNKEKEEKFIKFILD